jgi:hypothetical protein
MRYGVMFSWRLENGKLGMFGCKCRELFGNDDWNDGKKPEL